MGRKEYLIDTNIAIYYYGLVLTSDSESFFNEVVKDNFYISVINQIELLGCPGLSKKEYEALDKYIRLAEIIPIEDPVVSKTIEIRQKSRIKLPDAIIAATCLVNDYTLITINIKDFDKIEGLDIHPLELNQDLLRN